jgi:adenosylcobinamide-GDP ribazoletransferase
MHEDGLADAADGLCGYATRERALEIMRDSRIGSYGAAALSLSLLTRFAIYQELAKTADLISPLIAACLLSRACAVMLISTTPNARTESATSMPYSGGIPNSERPIFLILTFLVGLFLLHYRPLPIFAAALATVGLRAFFLRRIGGHTGDCLGATIAISELSALVAILFQ